MRWLLLADVHANLEALSAVLTHARDWADARVLVAGDIVGYGPDPEACIDLLSRSGALCVAGNHDGMVLGRISLRRCNYAGITAARWTRDVLSARARRWLADLPGRRQVGADLIVCHGDLDDPERYVDSAEHADRVLGSLGGRRISATRVICGHTHRPTVHGEGEPWSTPPTGVPVSLCRERRYLINPGAVGQSRFEAPIARYARYDDVTDELVIHAVPYDHRTTCRKLRQAGLVARATLPSPSRLGREIERLQTRWARWRYA